MADTIYYNYASNYEQLDGIKSALNDAMALREDVAKVFNASWQRCTVHFMRNIAAHAGRQGRGVVSAFIATAFAQPDAKAAQKQFRSVADQIRPKMPKLACLMDEAEADVLAYMSFPQQHWVKLHSSHEGVLCQAVIGSPASSQSLGLTGRGHPFVSTCSAAGQGAQRRSKRPGGPRRWRRASVLDRSEHAGKLPWAGGRNSAQLVLAHLDRSSPPSL